jgi:hypothetical protein
MVENFFAIMFKLSQPYFGLKGGWLTFWITVHTLRLFELLRLISAGILRH